MKRIRLKSPSTNTTDKPLLIPRSKARRKLNCSAATLSRMEKDGTLVAVKLRKRGVVYYQNAQIEHVAAHGVE